MAYSVVQDVISGNIQPKIFRRLSDGAFIPEESGNRDYDEMMAWVDDGGEIQQTDPNYTPYVPEP